MKNVRFATNSNITQEPQELERYKCVFIGKASDKISSITMSKATSIEKNLHFDQLAAASSSTSP